jgi:hypothetical protein
MGNTFTLVKQFGNPTFNSLTVSGSIRFTGDLIVTGSVTGTSFSGAGTGLTGTASSLSIGGNAATATSVSATYTGTNAGNLIYASMADNDLARIRVGGDSSNAGWMEIATADDGTEPIYVRQYTGTFSSITRTATLLDGSGNTSFPGTVSATFSGNLTGNASTATTATTTTGNAGSVTYLPGRTDPTAYPILWGAAYTNTIGTIAYSCAAVTIQSSTGTINATAVNLSGTITSLGNQFINNSSPTIYLQDTDNRSSMIHCNSNVFYVLRGNGNNSTTWATFNGYWPMELNLENNNASFGGSITAVSDITAYSDARVKSNITTIEKALDKVLQLRGVSYQRIDMESDKTHIGVIAQEIQKILPEVVSENDKGHLSVAYGNIVGILIEAIKEQQLQIEELKAKIG